ncbi:MAG: formate dehydrogenase subunit gamma [Rubrivivax sp.]|jgi:formate dehydrogenase subunit gamma|nr:formate dehydrogenase subunit gamma [Rubrivivax sp.]
MTHRADFDRDAAAGIIARLAHLDGAMLPVLHALQERFGYIDEQVIPLVADALNLSRAEVHGVVTFYHDFRRRPAGRHVLRICRAEACQSMGCEALVEHLAAEHGLSMGETTPDGRLTVEAVYCLGNCALSPAALLDDDLVGRVDRDTLDGLVAQARGALS